MADLEQLELLGLTNSITQELVNHTGLSDSTLAEFLIHLHTTSSNLKDFKEKCKQVGAEFPDSFLESVDRLVLSMHPQYKLKKKGKKGSKKGKGKELDQTLSQVIDPEKEKAKRLFPGLSLPDQEWAPTTEYKGKDAPKLALEVDQDQPVDVRGAERDARSRDESDLGIDGLMKELEGVSRKRGQEDYNSSSSSSSRYPGGGPDGKRQRQRSPDYSSSSSSRDRDDRDRGRSGYGGGRDPRIGGVGPNRLDEKPVLYKIYPGKVSNIKDFGCFVALEGIVGRQEGEI